MEVKDLPRFLNIRNQIRNSLHDSRYFTLEECQKWFGTKEQDYWLAISENNVLGYFRFQVHPNNPIAGVIGMDLDPAYHGHGYAKYLYLAFCEGVVPKYGVENLYLRVLKSNIRAQMLYQGMEMMISEETEVDYEMQISTQLLISNLRRQLSWNLKPQKE